VQPLQVLGPTRPGGPRLVREANTEPLPGYLLIERLGSGGFGEVWKCTAPVGGYKALKFILHNLGGQGTQAPAKPPESLTLQRVKHIRHPLILGPDRVELVGDDLLVLMELAEQNLHRVRDNWKARGHAGIPRDQLLAHLYDVAEALDLLNRKHDLPHLDVKPQNLFLVGNHVKVGDCGLVQTLQELNAGDPAGVRIAGLDPLYTPPEMQLGICGRSSDQYSLAIVYQELLTGVAPFHGRNSRQLAFQHARAEPDLAALPEPDRPLVATALAKDPSQRHPSCLDFIRALASLRSSSAGAAQPENRGLSETSAEIHLKFPALPAPAGPGNLAGAQPLPATPSLTPRVAAASPLPGCRFISCLSRNAVSESWVVELPDGRQRLGRLVHGYATNGVAERELLERVAALRHPALLPVEVLHGEGGRGLLAGDLPESTLRDLLIENQTRRLPGIPRRDLLRLLGPLADGLDALYHQHALQHLGLNPSNLLLFASGLRAADFGLAQLLWLPAGQPVAQFNLRYSPPELFDRQVNRACDQYSLALIFQEMLTGVHPFRGQPRPRGSGDRFRAKPDLELLGPEDRAVIGRALSAEPDRRYPCCGDFLRALESGPTPIRVVDGHVRRERDGKASAGLPSIIPWPAPPLLTAAAGPGPNLDDILSELLASAAGPLRVREHKKIGFLLHPGQSLEHRCAARLPPGVAGLKLSGFAQQWNARCLEENAYSYRFHIGLPGSFWLRCRGYRPALEVAVKLLSQRRSLMLTEVQVAVRPVGCPKDLGAHFLNELGPLVLASLRDYLQVYPEQRSQHRLICPQPLRVMPVETGLGLAAPIACQGKDISLTGIGFFLPGQPAAQQVYVNLAGNKVAESLAVLAKIRRVLPRGDGWFEVGAEFSGLRGKP
jgi:serine/threonine protein kinase